MPLLPEKYESPKPKILIVDDNQLSLRLLENILSEAGYAVIQATNGCDAVSLAKKENPNLIILDIAMPGLDGIDAALILKGDPMTRKMPIIFLSALVGREIKEGRDAVLNSTFLSKPVEKDALLREIAKYF